MSAASWEALFSTSASETTGLNAAVLSQKTTMTMSVEIQRALNSVITKHRDEVGDIIVVVNPDVLNRFKSEDAHILMELERSHTGRLIFRSDPSLHRERYAVVDAQTENSLAQG